MIMDGQESTTQVSSFLLPAVFQAVAESACACLAMAVGSKPLVLRVEPLIAEAADAEKVKTIATLVPMFAHFTKV